jgi:phospholipid transport system substrate-binding protein
VTAHSSTRPLNRKGVIAMAHQAGLARSTWPVSLAIAAFSTSIVCGPLPSSAQTVSTIAADPAVAVAQTRPLEIVKSSFSRVLAAEGSQRRIEIQRVTAELFDFHEMGRRMLGEHWQEGTREQQDEFVRLFAAMLDQAYLTNVANMPLASVIFEGELVSGPYARVSSRMSSRRGDTAIEYRLVNHGERWAVYDMSVDGVGLVSSYRSQFNSILRNSSFAELLARLRGRQASIKAEQGP